MKYFNSLPSVINKDSNNNFYLLRNILIRTKLLSQISRNPMLFYKYTIQEQDTPESIAHKYYGDVYRYWIVLISNEIMDPQWQWPLTNQQLLTYLANKYSVDAGSDDVVHYLTTTPHHYEKLVSTIDLTTKTTAIKTTIIDLNTYNLINEISKVKSFPSGDSISYTISKKIVSLYDYEINLNESKRAINLLNSTFVSDIEKQYEKLVRS